MDEYIPSPVGLAAIVRFRTNVCRDRSLTGKPSTFGPKSVYAKTDFVVSHIPGNILHYILQAFLSDWFPQIPRVQERRPGG